MSDKVYFDAFCTVLNKQNPGNLLTASANQFCADAFYNTAKAQ